MNTIMTENVLLKTYKSLPAQLQQEISDFVEFVKLKYQQKSQTTQNYLLTNRKRKLGKFAKGSFVMSNDFNAPLEHFRDYI